MREIPPWACRSERLDFYQHHDRHFWRRWRLRDTCLTVAKHDNAMRASRAGQTAHSVGALRLLAARTVWTAGWALAEGLSAVAACWGMARHRRPLPVSEGP